MQCKSFSISLLIGGLALLLSSNVQAVNPTNITSKNKTTSSVQNTDYQRVVKLIQMTYLYMNNGTINNILKSTNSPFYNYDEISMFGIYQTKDIISQGISFVPANFKFVKRISNEIHVNYYLLLKQGQKIIPTKTNSIYMVAKYIAGNWRLDCKEIFPVLRILKGIDNKTYLDSVENAKIKISREIANKNKSNVDEVTKKVFEQWGILDNKKDSNSGTKELIPVDLNDYLSVVNPNDTLTDWNYTELDDTSKNILNSNHIKFINGQWVKEVNKMPVERQQGLSYSSPKRELIGVFVTPIYDVDVEGKITVKIRINENGDVIQATIGQETNITNSELRKEAINAAKQLKFTKHEETTDASITYSFKLR